MKRRIGLVAAALVLGAAVYGCLHVRSMARIGSGYVAKELCSCIFVGGRSLDSCRPDVPESMDRIRVELLDDGVRAFVPGFAERIARHEAGYGCTLVAN